MRVLARHHQVLVNLVTSLVALGAMSQCAFAQAPPAAAKKDVKVEPFSLAYIPRDSFGVVSIRPSVLIGRPIVAPLQGLIGQISESTPQPLPRPEDIAAINVAVVPGRAEPTVAATLRLNSKEAATKWIASMTQRAQQATYNKQAYAKLPTNSCVFQPDALSIVFASDEPTIRRCILAGTKGASEAKWATTWKALAQLEAIAVINTSLLRAVPVQGAFEAMRQQRVGGLNLNQLVFTTAPLWQRSEYVFVDIRASNELSLRIVAQSATSEEAAAVHSALLTVISAARLGLSTGRAEMTGGDDEAAAFLPLLDAVDAMLENAKIVRKDVQVDLTAKTDQTTTKNLLSAAAPAVAAAEATRYRDRSHKNLHQLAIALHNYHDTYNRFPAAVQIGPKNVPHNWRVSILPFLDGVRLYEKYKLDEPWDSPANKEVLDAMPDVYRFPRDAGTSKNTPYVVLNGAETAFDGNKNLGIASILDGTSNTIMMVETKVDIPWTKPEDLPFEAEKPLPPLGGLYPGGFCVAFCDGSVRFLPNTLDKEQLKFLFMRADGRAVRF